MGPTKQRTVAVNADVTSTLNAASQAIQQCGWRVTFMQQSTIRATSGISFTSWGEEILVQVQVANGITYLNMQSKSAFALIDWGKNQSNVDKFIATLGRMLPIAFV